ncbi:MAG: 6-carboxytetrahydropterin synthase [Tenuifilaceae bacterium]|jgi:6-pyruvoyltetrahydropterin/6-carboxytetrahydropterin synthase|nr:6-carboxytetrahydropterin synthase [Tenuifilaceae bacterium]
MPIAYLTRRERFSAAHRLFSPELSESENFDVYGNCSHPNWHGHNYELFVTVKGEVNPKTGYVLNLKALSNIIRDKVIEKIDHRNINVDVEFMQGLIPTTENLVIAIWECLQADVEGLGATLHKIKLQETENNFVEYMGE